MTLSENTNRYTMELPQRTIWKNDRWEGSDEDGDQFVICSVSNVCCQGLLSLKNCCHGLSLNLGHQIITGSWILCFSSRPPTPPHCLYAPKLG